MIHSFKISGSNVDYYFNGEFKDFVKTLNKKKTFFITDENVWAAQSKLLKLLNPIVVKAGEQYKNFETLQYIIHELIKREADRSSLLVGIGGGVVTDITGFAASVYMRGIEFGFVPTSLLNMVDASLGGKNGIDVGVYKNMIGRIEQPQFIFQDIGFLETLPQSEWENGFAEIVKHACIKDVKMFHVLANKKLTSFQENEQAMKALITQNVLIKLKVVQKDVNEKGDRKLLNFGHTLGHAIETNYNLSHGHAISIGMMMAANLSEKITGFKDAEKLQSVLSAYNLPTQLSFNAEEIFEIMKMDKKRSNKHIHFILLDNIGKAAIHAIGLSQLKKHLQSLEKIFA